MLVATPKIFQNQFSFNLGLLISLYIHVIIILNLTVTVDGKVLGSRNIYNTRLFVTKTAVGISLTFISSFVCCVSQIFIVIFLSKKSLSETQLKCTVLKIVQ